MTTFQKFEFTPTQWATLKKTIQTTTTTPEGGEATAYNDCAVHEIGFICLEWDNTGEFPTCKTQSDKWAVDILWFGEIPSTFAPYQVWPTPVGIHTFAGWEQAYAEEFCAKFPDNPYCVIPEKNEII